MSALPRISIVTPCLNQAAFIEKAMLSVLEQDYPDIEYLVIDGGSTDGTVDVIKKHASRLAYWVSERDRGQSDAINKGLRRATGELFAFLNSDDWYFPGAFRAAAESLATANAEGLKYHWVSGRVKVFHQDGHVEDYPPPFRPDYIDILFRDRGYCAMAPRTPFGWASCFWRRDMLSAVGPFREDMHFAMDLELYSRLLLSGYRPLLIDDVLAASLIHPASKTGKGCDSTEKDRICEMLAPLLNPRELRRARFLSEMRRVGRASTASSVKALSPLRLVAAGLPFRYPLQFCGGVWHRLRGRPWSGISMTTGVDTNRPPTPGGGTPA